MSVVLNSVGQPIGNVYNAVIDVEAIGAKLNGSADDTEAIQEAIDFAYDLGGGVVRGFSGRTARTTAEIVVKDNVFLHLEGGGILSQLSGASEVGVRVRTRSAVYFGSINVESSGSPGTQAMAHAAIGIGPLSSEGGTVASPSVDEGVFGWYLGRLQLHSDKVTGGACIQGNGGIHHGLIEFIDVPDSATLFGVLMLDWSYLGTISSQPADMATNRTNFNAGNAYTTHPHHITVRHIKAGALTRPNTGLDTGSRLIRLSGCDHISVKQFEAEQVTYALVHHHAGDLGYEFAPPAIKKRALKNSRIETGWCPNTNDSWLGLIDSQADNVAAAVSGFAYVPLLDPLHKTNLKLVGVAGVGSGGGSVTDGILFHHIRGGEADSCSASGYLNGANLDESCYGTRITKGSYYGNREEGVKAHHATNPPADCVIDGVESYLNGAAGGNHAGVYAGETINLTVENCVLGHEDPTLETTQGYGIRAASTAAIGLKVKNNHVRSVDSGGGIAYSLLSSTDYGVVDLFAGNTVAPGFSGTVYGGLNMVPIKLSIGSDGVQRHEFEVAKGDLTANTTPTTGTFLAGERAWYTNPSAADYAGTLCITGGSPGTWAKFAATA